MDETVNITCTGQWQAVGSGYLTITPLDGPVEWAQRAAAPENGLRGHYMQSDLDRSFQTKEGKQLYIKGSEGNICAVTPETEPV